MYALVLDNRDTKDRKAALRAVMSINNSVPSTSTDEDIRASLTFYLNTAKVDPEFAKEMAISLYERNMADIILERPGLVRKLLYHDFFGSGASLSNYSIIKITICGSLDSIKVKPVERIRDKFLDQDLSNMYIPALLLENLPVPLKPLLCLELIFGPLFTLVFYLQFSTCYGYRKCAWAKEHATSMITKLMGVFNFVDRFRSQFKHVHGRELLLEIYFVTDGGLQVQVHDADLSLTKHQWFEKFIASRTFFPWDRF